LDHHGEVDTVAIGTDTIRLGQLLKLAGMVDSGSDAKLLLAGGEVSVNGEPETRRGRTLRIGDEVRLGQAAVRVVAR
jgi:ribosome-associated protein